MEEGVRIILKKGCFYTNYTVHLLFHLYVHLLYHLLQSTGKHWNKREQWFNPYLANVLILYLLKTPEKRGFLLFLGSIKMGTLAKNGLKMV